ncbi:MAG TPA: PP2C family serine/threonine-protein phosphatase [Chthonomonadaceae bacterium]|nr:PP2C family serine/threonine-protein phosphatase [Chthonomonadaceae bacterium]
MKRAAEAHSWRVVAASVRGASHERTGQPCQDAHCWAARPGGVLVAAVADGAGSAALAEVGAETAARTAVEILAACAGIAPPESEAAWQMRLLAALQAAREAVLAEAEAREAPVRELATTLILAVATPDRVAAAQVGDGAAVVRDREGNLHALTAPECGEYINETTFLIAPGAAEAANVTVWQGAVTHLALLSDGLQRLALRMPDGEPHAPFFAPLFRFVEGMTDVTEAEAQLAAFLRSPRVSGRTDDDLTLLLASLLRE